MLRTDVEPDNSGQAWFDDLRSADQTSDSSVRASGDSAALTGPRPPSSLSSHPMAAGRNVAETRLRERSSRASSWLRDSVRVSANRSTPPRSEVGASWTGRSTSSGRSVATSSSSAPRTSLGGRPRQRGRFRWPTRTESLRRRFPAPRRRRRRRRARLCSSARRRRPGRSRDRRSARWSRCSDPRVGVTRHPQADARGRIDRASRQRGDSCGTESDGISPDDTRGGVRKARRVPVEETIGVELIGGRVVPVAGDRWSQHLVDQRDLRMFDRLIVGTDGA